MNRLQSTWLLSLALGCLAHAQVVEYDIQLQGGKIGGVAWEEKADGTFTSKSQLKVATTDATSVWTGKLEKGDVTAFDLTEKSGGSEGRVVFANGKIDVYVNGKKQLAGKATDLKGKIPISNLQMPLLREAIRQVSANKATQKVTIFSMNGLADVPSTVKSFTDKKIEVPDAPNTISVLVLDLGGLVMEIYGTPTALYGVNIPSQQFRVVRKGFQSIFTDPLARYPELSKPEFQTIAEVGIKMKTRDGAELVSDVIRPKSDQKFPVILVRTPYGRAASALEGNMYAQRGYVYVAQDVRGKGDSTGDWDPFNREVEDGKDTLDWLVQQPWCDGNVGMIGGSYLGLVQWAAAVNHHPALKCIVPQVSPPEPMLNIPWDNGAFTLQGNLWWSRIVQTKVSNMAIAMTPLKNLKALETLPLTQTDDKFLGNDIKFFDDWLKRPAPHDWKGAYTTQQVSQVKIPVLHISGNWDGDGIGTLTHWNALRATGGNQWMIFGPWEHGFNAKTKFGDVEYGRGSILELNSIYIRFFDTYLKGRKVEFDKQPRVRMFVTGANRWVETSDWPMPGSKPKTVYLGGGKANGWTSKGTLEEQPPAANPDRYIYDPAKIKVGKAEQEMDSSSATTKITKERINDEVLLYKSAPFTKKTRIGGPMTCEFNFSTTVKDATLHVFVCEESSTGELRVLGLQGTRRATFQDDGSRTPLVPNQVYKVKVQPWNFAHEFAPGSRIVLMVFSNFFPSFARNPGTGEPDANATKLLKATHTIYKDSARPSTFTYQEMP